MNTALLPALLIVTSIGGARFLRKRRSIIRLAFGTACLAGYCGMLFVASETAFLRPETPASGGGELGYRLLAALWWIAAARLTATLVVLLLGHDDRSRQARLSSDLISAGIYVAAGLFVLNSILGLPINGLIATSGVIAIVLGLALQNTLADVFSGIAVGIEHPFSVGDRLKVEDNVEGIVAQMNWRSVRLLTDGRDLMTIPNSVVAKTKVLNRSAPTARRATEVQILCSSATPPDFVFTLLQNASMLCEELGDDAKTSVNLVRLGPRTSAYAVAFVVKDSGKVETAKSSLLLQAWRQFHHGGVGDQSSADGKTLPLRRGLPPEKLLSDIVLFESLQPEQRLHLSTQLTLHTLQKGDRLFEQGDMDATLYIIATGVLELLRSSESAKAEALGRIGAGEYIGEIGLLTGAPHAATAVALTPCDVYELPESAMRSLISENVALAPALDSSLRRGLDLVHRDTAARMSQQITGATPLLDRIRHYFGLA